MDDKTKKALFVGGALLTIIVAMAAYIKRKEIKDFIQKKRYAAIGVCPICGLDTGLGNSGYCQFCETIDLKPAEKQDDKESFEAGKVRLKFKITKDQAKELLDHITKFPKPAGWDKYYGTKISPKLRKVMKATSVVGANINPMAWAITIPATFIASRSKKFKELGSKAYSKLDKLVKEVMGRAVTLVGIYIQNDSDFKKTLDVIKSAHYSADDKYEAGLPTVEIDWSKVDASKLFQAALMFADDLVPSVSAVGGVAASETGVGAIVGGVGAGITGVIAAGDDLLALKTIVGAVKPALKMSGKTTIGKD